MAVDAWGGSEATEWALVPRSQTPQCVRSLGGGSAQETTTKSSRAFLPRRRGAAGGRGCGGRRSPPGSEEGSPRTAPGERSVRPARGRSGLRPSRASASFEWRGTKTWSEARAAVSPAGRGGRGPHRLARATPRHPHGPALCPAARRRPADRGPRIRWRSARPPARPVSPAYLFTHPVGTLLFFLFSFSLSINGIKPYVFSRI